MPRQSPSRLQTLPHRHWAVWLVLLVALASALAPTVSHALAWGQGSSPTVFEICSADGPRTVSAADSAPDEQPMPKLAHCPFCLQPTDPIAPPPQPVAHLIQAGGGFQDGSVWQALFHPDNFYPKAAPRGPPAFLRS